MISIVLPDDELRHRLGARLGDARVQVWAPNSSDPLIGPIDLLVLPYMIAPRELRHLRGLPISMVQSQTLGYDGVSETLPSGIRYCNATDVHEGSTAELTVGLILAAQRGIPDAVRDADRGVWEHRRHPGLADKRVVLVGVGGVGAEIRRRIAPFGAHLDLVARTPRAGVHGVDRLPELLSHADIVIIAVPLTDDTRRFIDSRFLAAMRDGALLVNVSRGEIVDTEALVGELQEARLRAALDVTDPEPLPADHPLWRLPGVLITPHAGGDTDAMDARVDGLILEQVRRLRAGEAPLNLVYDAAG
ncbi:2-hydroxyacid dehydrogenase [Microbacterium sp. HD4P20]|uniref:2-hydroxyacid dehydrogenase n=1 Tax=Microbacterium sp. HD4P20 TaxID=2864874 RepID=UPI001C63BA9C|nr:2-hydroxyacid dehydrogenase [Microbacterium sp. HD4P20]MCP2636301.1 2-hydroxyacid dehydrogenase [Microbacterium sp. HD4P20]